MSADTIPLRVLVQARDALQAARNVPYGKPIPDNVAGDIATSLGTLKAWVEALTDKPVPVEVQS